MQRLRWMSGFGMAIALGMVASAHGQVPIEIPNGSFENPATVFAFPDADEWDETGPVGEDPQLPGVVDTLDTGVFFNSPVDGEGQPSPFFIPNGDGLQIGFIGADDASTIAFFQELPEVYEVGGTYTVNLLVGESFFFPPLTFNPNDPNPPPDPDPALLELSLYYTSGSGDKIVVTDRIVSAEEMPDGPSAGLLLVDVATTGMSVQASDAWAGAPIGVMIRPVLGLSGVWNVDHARLAVTCATGTPGDADLDGDVDLADHAALAGCLTGPQNTDRPTGCPPCAYARLDADGDDDIDLRDFAELMERFGN
jgi:hypothetical protein